MGAAGYVRLVTIFATLQAPWAAALHDEFAHFLGLEAFLDAVPDLLLLAGRRMNDHWLCMAINSVGILAIT
jgi:hypothetical protein